jgi:glycosyltransferase involved in cell wall biosynthesis
LYRTADVFCLPTLGDCLPMVLSEAAAVGLPLVSTNVGAIGEIVHDGVNGLLVPPGEIEMLAQALGELAEDGQRREQMARAAQATASAAFDAAANARRLGTMLFDLADHEH